MNNTCAILVLSCDKYSTLWKPFFTQFYKYWRKCPYKVYLGAETKKYNDNKVITINTKLGIDWSSRLLMILESIKEDYVFIWLEDYFITDYIDEKLFTHCIKFLQNEKANHIQMTPSIPPDGYHKDPLFAYTKKGAPYRVAAYGFWKKDHLQKLLLPGENIWQFEIFGSYRSGFYDGYFSLRKNLFKHIQIVARGQIFREAYDYCIKHQIELDLSGWRIHSQFHKIKDDILRYIFVGIIHIPWGIRLSIMNIFRKALASY